MKNNIWLIGVIFLVLVFISIALRNSDGVEAPMLSDSTGEEGAALLFQTWENMGFDVKSLRVSISEERSFSTVLVISPQNELSQENIDSLLEFASSGGRLIYLRGDSDYYLELQIRLGAGIQKYERFGFINYEVGLGEIITGDRNRVLNRALFENPSAGIFLTEFLNPDEVIFFADYYHRIQSRTQNDEPWRNFARAQVFIIAIIILWHAGKRFGFAHNAYETEREEDEEIFNLARLYEKTRKNG